MKRLIYLFNTKDWNKNKKLDLIFRLNITLEINLIEFTSI